MSFAPPSSRYDVGFEHKNGRVQWVARNVDRMEAEDLAFHPDKPPGSKFILKLIHL